MFKKILCFSFLSISYLASSQNATSSEIIISEENLIALLQKLKQKKAENALLLKESGNETELKLSPFYTNESVITIEKEEESTNNKQLSEITSQLLQLRYEIKYLNDQLNRSKGVSSSADLIVVTSPTKSSAPLVTSNNEEIITLQKDLELLEMQYKNDLQKLKLDAKNTALANKNEVLKREIVAKKEKIATMSAQKAGEKATQNETPKKVTVNAVTKAEAVPVETKSIREQKSIVENAITPIANQNTQDFMKGLNPDNQTKETIIFESSFSSDYRALVEKYGSIKNQVFFDNNATTIKDSDKIQLEKMIGLLNQEENLDLYLIGFASQKGSVIHNQKLSAKRTEVIKEFLISKGIHPTRILTQYHGIDYSTDDEATARRVDASYIIRK